VHADNYFKKIAWNDFSGLNMSYICNFSLRTLSYNYQNSHKNPDSTKTYKIAEFVVSWVCQHLGISADQPMKFKHPNQGTWMGCNCCPTIQTVNKFQKILRR
jgi:hypothetical protein